MQPTGMTQDGEKHPTSIDGMDSSAIASALSAQYKLIDPSLIYAMVTDYESEVLQDHIDSIRDQLAYIEATTVPDTGSSPSIEQSDVESDSNGLCDFGAYGINSDVTHKVTTKSNASVNSDNEILQNELHGRPQRELSEFLVTLFANISPDVINSVTESEESVEAMIDRLLLEEYITNEQSNTESDAKRNDDQFVSSYSVPAMTTKKTMDKGKRKMKPNKQKQETITIPLVDTLQRQAHHFPPSSRKQTGLLYGQTSGQESDIWTSFTSFAEFLHQLVPRASVAHFLSHLHSDRHGYTENAVKAALASLPSLGPPLDQSHPALAVLQDLYGPSLDGDDRTSEDLRLCIHAVGMEVSSVMDIMDILAELRESQDYNKDLVHHAPVWRSSGYRLKESRIGSRLPHDNSQHLPQNKAVKGESADPDINSAAVSLKIRHANVKSNDLGVVKPPQGSLNSIQERRQSSMAWQTVPKSRRKRDPAVHRLSSHIPAYAHNELPKASRQDDSSIHQQPILPSEFYMRGEKEWRKREYAIRAARQYLGGAGPKGIRSAISSYYAAQAREATERAKEWELRGARVVVEGQLSRSGHTIDLHHMTVEQATTLAHEAVNTWWTRAGQTKYSAGNIGGQDSFHPLIVITGKGHHSISQKGVLGPSVEKSLAADGWRIERAEGYIIVKGRK